MILQFGGNPRIGNFGGWGFCRIWWNSWWFVIFGGYLSHFWILVIGNYLVGFLSARHLVEIPELENLNLEILVTGNFGD